MSSSIFICLISGIFWALFDLTRKMSLKVIKPKILLILFSTLQIIIFLIWCINESFNFFITPYFFPGLTLVLLGIFSAFIFLKSIKESELSLTIPLLSFSPLFSSFFSYLFLAETLNKQQYLGIFIIIFGTLFLYTKKLNLSHFLKSFQNIINSKSANLMILVSFCWSLTPVLDKICLKYSSVNFHGLIQSILTFIFLVIFSFKDLTALKKKRIRSLTLVFITLCIGTFATILQFYAILFNFVPIMESIKRATGQFSAVIFGRIFFNEKITVQKIIGVSLLSYGVFLII